MTPVMHRSPSAAQRVSNPNASRIGSTISAVLAIAATRSGIGNGDFGAEDMELVLLLEQDLRAEGEIEPAVPAGEPGSEERPRQRRAAR